jgi:hypothetical protein
MTACLSVLALTSACSLSPLLNSTFGAELTDNTAAAQMTNLPKRALRIEPAREPGWVESACYRSGEQPCRRKGPGPLDRPESVRTVQFSAAVPTFICTLIEANLLANRAAGLLFFSLGPLKYMMARGRSFAPRPGSGLCALHGVETGD